MVGICWDPNSIDWCCLPFGRKELTGVLLFYRGCWRPDADFIEAAFVGNLCYTGIPLLNVGYTCQSSELVEGYYLYQWYGSPWCVVSISFFAYPCVHALVHLFVHALLFIMHSFLRFVCPSIYYYFIISFKLMSSYFFDLQLFWVSCGIVFFRLLFWLLPLRLYHHLRPFPCVFTHNVRVHSHACWHLSSKQPCHDSIQPESADIHCLTHTHTHTHTTSLRLRFLRRARHPHIVAFQG